MSPKLFFLTIVLRKLSLLMRITYYILSWCMILDENLNNEKRQYRSEIHVIHDILRALNNSLNGYMPKTRLFYASNLNSAAGSSYLERLLGCGAISIHGRKFYKLTMKGIRILALIEMLRKELEGQDGWRINAMHLLKELVAERGIKVRSNVGGVGKTGVPYYFDLILDPKGSNPIAIVFEREEHVNLIMPWMLLSMLGSGYKQGFIIADSKRDGEPTKLIADGISIEVLHLDEISRGDMRRLLQALPGFCEECGSKSLNTAK